VNIGKKQIQDPVDNWFVYLVRCKDGSLYCGITNDIENRLKTHNLGKGSKSCKAHGLPVELVWIMGVENRSIASKIEYDIKKLTKKEKENLIVKAKLN